MKNYIIRYHVERVLHITAEDEQSAIDHADDLGLLPMDSEVDSVEIEYEEEC